MGKVNYIIRFIDRDGWELLVLEGTDFLSSIMGIISFAKRDVPGVVRVTVDMALPTD